VSFTLKIQDSRFKMFNCHIHIQDVQWNEKQRWPAECAKEQDYTNHTNWREFKALELTTESNSMIGLASVWKQLRRKKLQTELWDEIEIQDDNKARFEFGQDRISAEGGRGRERERERTAGTDIGQVHAPYHPVCGQQGWAGQRLHHHATSCVRSNEVDWN